MPFDFVTMSLRNNPIPNDFGGHMLQLALAIEAHDKEIALNTPALEKTRKARLIFDRMARLVASSISLDCVRHRKVPLHGFALRVDIQNAHFERLADTRMMNQQLWPV
ncbi:hypothetical protein J4E86_011639 [Alternaria arbusti]|uniref:uncharacterized protein n=1 Tax=Alternaria arbusti TaxID=232088 RepID=UPI00221FC8A7|nr:uncharacterized protein J4E86_011639 [Alternaria arbusti]KAI4931072.1 hypothetical protein J4E86_011639 [Alternaria arbusti]